MLRGAFLPLALLALAACAPRPVVCDAVGSCGTTGVCITGRCVSGDGGLSLSKARRYSLEPTEIAFIERGRDAPAGSLPSVVTLGRKGAPPAAVLLRFPIPRDREVLEAYVTLDRAPGGLWDGAGVGLHAEAIAGDWSAATVRFSDGPPLDDVRAPSIIVRRDALLRLRIDVAPLLAKGDDAARHGIALVADDTTPSGVSVALTADVTVPLAGDPEGAGALPELATRGPRLELYVK